MSLSLVLRHAAVEKSSPLGEDLWRCGASDLIVDGIHWLSGRQNKDGGWGNVEAGQSNTGTTTLVQAALHLTAVPARHADLLGQAAEYVRRQGGVAEVRRQYAGDKSFEAAVLTNCALAGMVRWREVPALPFEVTCLPPWYRQLRRIPDVNHDLPVLIAVGQARFFHRPPLNPLVRWLRRACLKKSLRLLEQMSPVTGGYLEAIAPTSFVVMSLASIGQIEHPALRRGVEFLLTKVRADGSWPA